MLEFRNYYHNPICSMYGIFIYVWPKFMVNVNKYAIHGAFAKHIVCQTPLKAPTKFSQKTTQEGRCWKKSVFVEVPFVGIQSPCQIMNRVSNHLQNALYSGSMK